MTLSRASAEPMTLSRARADLASHARASADPMTLSRARANGELAASPRLRKNLEPLGATRSGSFGS